MIKLNSEDYSSAVDYANLLLSYRKRSRKELLDKLKFKGYSDSIMERVLNSLEELGYINDTEFVIWWINTRRKNRPKGDVVLRYELRNKGVTDSIIESAFEIINSEKQEDEFELAWKACGSMLESYRKLPVNVAKRRLYAFLKRRGFSWRVIDSILDKFFED